MPRISLPSGPSLAYRQQGEGRPPIVLLHGAGGSSLVWTEVLGLLGPLGRRVVAPDLPGHGNSAPFSRPPHPSRLLERYRDVVAELGEHLGLGRFVLVGHSMGGAVAQLLALTYPDRIHALVLAATAARLQVAPVLLDTLRRRFDQFSELLAGAGFSPASDPARVRTWAARQVQAPREVVLADFLACARFDQRASLAALRCPTLVISASDDRLTPPNLQRRLGELIPRARLEAVSRAGHFLAFERPDRLAELIDGVGRS
jgi:pimeloyl-ACP methyl ester carboxylesterase